MFSCYSFHSELLPLHLNIQDRCCLCLLVIPLLSHSTIKSSSPLSFFPSLLLWFNPTPGILVMISSFTLAMGNIGAAKKLHNNLLVNKLHTPQSFFDTTPIGRIINRFSKDIYVIDEALPATVLMFLGTFFVSLSTMIVIIATTPIFAIVIAPLALIYVFVQVLGEMLLMCQMMLSVPLFFPKL